MPEAPAPNLQEMTARHTATLARIAALAEQMAAKHAERMLSTDDPEVEAKATMAFNRVTRSLRQCLALEAKLVRDAVRFERDTQLDLSHRADATSLRRKVHVKRAVERLIWTEAETSDIGEQLCGELDDLLDIEEFAAGFTEEPVDAQIARICADLGVVLTDTQSPYYREPAAPGGTTPIPELRSSA